MIQQAEIKEFPESSENSPSIEGGEDPFRILNKRKNPELVIALVGRVGAGCSKAAEKLKRIFLENYGYDIRYIKVSEKIREDFLYCYDEFKDHKDDDEIINEKINQIIEFCEDGNISSLDFRDRQREIAKFLNSIEDSYSRTRILQIVGNALRRKFGSHYLACRIVEDIYGYRESKEKEMSGEEDTERVRNQHRIVYIIDSLKNIEEERLLRSIYRGNFFLVSIIANPREISNRLKKMKIDKSKIEKMLLIDEDEGINEGQGVRDLIEVSDYFVNNNDEAKLDHRLERFASLMFSYGINTPTIEEYGMFLAWGAAAMSSCLSRQVGACILSVDGKVISTGYNEVPNLGGNNNSNNNSFTKDLRCYSCNEFCTKDKINNEDVRHISKLIDEVSPPSIDENIVNLVKDEISKMICSRIEYSRAVHAEMMSIINSYSNIDNSDKIMFTTTYPCHYCMGHIILYGIKKIFYIEAFPKSMSEELYSDLISFGDEVGKVSLIQYTGVSPKRYLDIYKKVSHDIYEEGNILSINRKEYMQDYRKPERKKHFPSIDTYYDPFIFYEMATIQYVQEVLGGSRDD